MFKTALLILTQPLAKIRAQLPYYMSEINRLVTKTAYIHLQPENCSVPTSKHQSSAENGTSSSHSAFHMLRIPFSSEIRNIVKDFYVFNAKTCSNIDIRVLVGHFQNTDLNFRKYDLKEPCDVIMIDRNIAQSDISVILKSVSESFNVSPLCEEVSFLKSNDSEKLDVGADQSQCLDKSTKIKSATSEEIEQYRHTVLGGTFDRLHIGHKILLSEGCLLATEKLTVGVTCGEMNKKKTLEELIQPTDERISDVKQFLTDIKPSLEYSVVPITDAYGPTVTEPDMDLIVLSQETKKGGEMVNTEREKRGFKRLLEYTIELVEDSCHSQYEEEKISSSSARKRLLGTLYHPLKPKDDLPHTPYIIGLTGGIASGKSSVCKRLEGQGAKIVDCDKLGHRAYVNGTPGFDKIVAAFGQHIIGEDGEINRKELGKIVFGSKDDLQRLNGIIWPEIAHLAQEQISKYAQAGDSIIVLDAAVLLEAGWDNMCHEVWTTIVPQPEAIKRMVERNNLTEEQAKQRLNSQISNIERVEKSNVVLCTLWEYDYTQQQVEKAWQLLIKRLNIVNTKSNM